MIKSIFIVFMSLSIAMSEVNWNSEQIVTLKRNEVYKMNLLVGVNDVRELLFHWTLFVDGGLVFLAKYDSFNHQMILRKEYKRDWVRLGLSKEGKRGKLSPYVVIFFQDFDQKNKSAIFKVVTYGDVFVQ